MQEDCEREMVQFLRSQVILMPSNQLIAPRSVKAYLDLILSLYH